MINFTFSAADALQHANMGHKVRHTTWAEGQYVYMDEFGNLFDERGYAWGGSKANLIFDGHPVGWELYSEQTDPEEDDEATESTPIGSDEATESTPIGSDEEVEHEFWFGPKNPRSKCDCGAQYTDEGHSDWCTSQTYQRDVFDWEII